MNDVKGSPSQEPDPEALTGTLTFRLGTVGALVGARFTAAVEDLGVKPKHVGLLSVLSSERPRRSRTPPGRWASCPAWW